MGALNREFRICLVDDHPLVRRGLTRIIDAEPDLRVCGEASTMDEALGQIEESAPDLVVVDISLGDGASGIDLIKAVKAAYPEIKTLVSSMHDESLLAERALRAGARGYLNKAQPPETLVQAIRQVLEGRIALSPQTAERMRHQAVSTGKTTGESPLQRLTDRESEVFEMIGRGQTTQTMAANLNLSPKTVETYREHIKMKLGLEGSAEVMRHAVQWVLQGE